MLTKQTKSDISSVVDLTLEVFETWEGTKKEAGTDANLGEFFMCLKYCVNALSSGGNWQQQLTRSLEIDDKAIDESEAGVISDARAIAEDSARLAAVKKFFDISVLDKVASAAD